MKRCQWDARIELVCINLDESATVDGGKVIEKPAAPAALAALKARQEAVQLWVRGRLAILNLPRICRTCRICPRRDRFGIPFDNQDRLRRPTGALPYSAAVALLRLGCEDVP